MIYEKLEELTNMMNEARYVPNTNFVFNNVEDEKKEQFLSYHSEKLVIVFGLISIPRRMPIRIIKNIYICGDCHTTSKLISKIVGRELIVKNVSWYHHFKDGMFSCGDFWQY